MKKSSRIYLIPLFVIFHTSSSSSAYISNNNDGTHLRQSSSTTQQRTKMPTPPFPDGPCSGRIVTIPGDTLYNKQKQQANNSILDTILKSNPFLPSSSSAGLPKRDINVWLPREYDEMEYQKENFPILYCHDGQNAMSDAESWTGKSWRLTGAISRLHEHSLLRIPTPPIIVLLPCGKGITNFPLPNQRHAEYGDIMEPYSIIHGDFVAHVLHPHITSNFRVAMGPEHTFAIGSSLGGQASLQLILRYPHIFGGAACLSPCFQAGTIAATWANLVQEPRDSVKSLHSKILYIDNGGDTEETRVPVFDVMDHFTLNDQWLNPGFWWLDTQLQPTVDAVRWALERGGVDFCYKKFPGEYELSVLVIMRELGRIEFMSLYCSYTENKVR
eukprot:scaffold30636_cov100-Cyclotella_meneghiniana.AAC.8